MTVPATRCARCVARLCGHPQCKPGGRTELKITDVAGTSCCADCAPVLLELVLHPLPVRTATATRHGWATWEEAVPDAAAARPA